MNWWPFKSHRKAPSREKEIHRLQLDVSRERTKLYASLDALDHVGQSTDFDLMVSRSLKLMEPNK